MFFKGVYRKTKKVKTLSASIIIPNYTFSKNKKVNETGEKLFKQLSKKGFRTTYDNRENLRPGFKFNDWELKGVPLRIEIGPKDIENQRMVLAKRYNLEKMLIRRISKLVWRSNMCWTFGAKYNTNNPKNKV